MLNYNNKMNLNFYCKISFIIGLILNYNYKLRLNFIVKV